MSLKQIQAGYFEIIRRHAPKSWLKIAESDVNVIDAMQSAIDKFSDSDLLASVNGRIVSTIELHYRDLLLEISEYWQVYIFELREEIRTLQGLTLMGSLTFPDDMCNVVTSNALYFDTVCFSDPLYHSKETLDYMEERDPTYKMHHLAISIVTLLRLEKLALADTDYPICAIVPNELTRLQKPGYLPDEIIGQQYTLAFYKELFEIYEDDVNDFASLRETLCYIPDYSMRHRLTSNPLFGKIAPLAKLGDTPYSLDFTKKSMSDLSNSAHTDAERLFLTTSPHIYPLLREDARLELDCNLLKADRHISGGALNWELHKWRTNLGEQKGPSTLSEEQVFLGASRLKELAWLANVDLENVVKLRENGNLENMRELFRLGRARLRKASKDDLKVVSEEVCEQIAEHIDEHNKTLGKTGQRNIVNLAVGSGRFLASGIFAIASALTAAPVFVAIATALGFVAGTSGFDLIQQLRDARSEVDDLDSRPISILMRARESDPAA